MDMIKFAGRLVNCKSIDSLEIAPVKGAIIPYALQITLGSGEKIVEAVGEDKIQERYNELKKEIDTAND